MTGFTTDSVVHSSQNARLHNMLGKWTGKHNAITPSKAEADLDTHTQQQATAASCVGTSSVYHSPTITVHVTNPHQWVNITVTLSSIGWVYAMTVFAFQAVLFQRHVSCLDPTLN